MWMVDPRRMCDRHLLGEHVELHMLVGSIRKGIGLGGYIDGGLVEVHSIRKRHAALASEMRRRGMRHRSALPAFRSARLGRVDAGKSLRDLRKRCPDCRKGRRRRK